MDDLDRLFVAYREAIPDPDASASFTPGIWQRIESRRSPVRFFRRLAEALVTAAAVATILLGSFLIPKLRNATVYSATYIDILADEQTAVQQYAEVVRRNSVAEVPEE